MLELNFDAARRNMVEQQVRPWKVFNERVLDVMSTVPRERFVPQQYRNMAYADWDIPLAQGQIMESPKLVGRMLETLSIKPGEQVLEIGTGSGYLTACMAALGARVESVEYFPELANKARVALESTGYKNLATVLEGDAINGWTSSQVFDAIIITASIKHYRDMFERQLKAGGRLLVVVGEPPIMQALLVQKNPVAGISRTSLFETSLPPMLGEDSTKAFVL